MSETDRKMFSSDAYWTPLVQDALRARNCYTVPHPSWGPDSILIDENDVPVIVQRFVKLGSKKTFNKERWIHTYYDGRSQHSFFTELAYSVISETVNKRNNNQIITMLNAASKLLQPNANYMLEYYAARHVYDCIREKKSPSVQKLCESYRTDYL